ALDDRHLPAETADRLRQLYADRPTAQDQQPARDLLHPRRLSIRPDALELAQSGNRWNDRVSAICKDDVLGGVAHALDLDRTGPPEPAAAAEQVDAVVRQPALLAGVGVVRDHEVPPGERGLDIDLRGRSGVAGGLRRLARS